MFRIVNVINNNVALAKNENHEEVMIQEMVSLFRRKRVISLFKVKLKRFLD